VKPQFEVGRERLGRSGVVTSAHERRRVLREVAGVVADQGLHLHGATASPIAGGDGNREFLFWLAPRPVPGASVTAVDDMLGAIDLEGAP
jgi:23S rRNA (cytidine1920-2'-O)/16S rRNA (cytidine1409-2'-O)-methyltransferase